MKNRGFAFAFILLALVFLPALSTQAQSNSTTDAVISAATLAPETSTASAPFSATHSINLLPASLTPKPKSPAASNNDDLSRWELLLGYAFLSNNIAVVDDGDLRQGLHGYAFQLVYNVNKNVGLMFDFSGHHGTDTDFGFFQTEDQYYYIFGPVLTHQIGKVRISAHFGAGVARQHYGENFCEGECGHFGVKQTNFAAEAGGAMDLICHRHWGWRVIQFDYLFSEFNGESLSNVRVSTGLIIRF
jgi:hypothetical protein